MKDKIEKGIINICWKKIYFLKNTHFEMAYFETAGVVLRKKGPSDSWMFSNFSIWP